MPARAQRSGLVTTWPPTRCFAATVRSDADRDGIDDRCEHDLAAHFAPELLVDERDCLWDARAARLAGGYFYLVQRAG
ncbi:MAG TPA: hypothetical protein VEA99_03875, partial [Gemmatimonadaceae bacterium]|nr:hypothetical protein [Gemmatimonadaceae bacterium]